MFNAESNMGSIGAIYIIHRDYGVAPVLAFADSYRRFHAGITHELIVAFKNFDDEKEKQQYRIELSNIVYREISVPCEGFDIGTYLYVAKAVEKSFYVLFNTNAVILTENWLTKLLGAFADPGVGLAGASGSWQSLAGYERRFRRGAPMPRWWSGLRMTVRYLRALRRFPAYPNPHLRTTALLVPAAVMQRVLGRTIRTRQDATAFESGRSGLTRVVRRMGLRAVVVDRAGGIHEQENWPHSATFRQGEQEMLLAADNRTRDYQDADAAERARLHDFSWSYP